MSLEQITNGLRERVGEDCGLDAKVKFDFADDGVVFLDATQVPNVVSNEDAESDCTLKMSMSDFMDMVNGELDGTTAFMLGKLKVDGDLGLAMKLRSVIGG